MLFVGCDLNKLINVSKADYNFCRFNRSDSIKYLTTGHFWGVKKQW